MIDKKTGLWIYNKMNEIRAFEEAAWTLFTERTSCVALFICIPARKLLLHQFVRSSVTMITLHPPTAATATASPRAPSWIAHWPS